MTPCCHIAVRLTLTLALALPLSPLRSEQADAREGERGEHEVRRGGRGLHPLEGLHDDGLGLGLGLGSWFGLGSGFWLGLGLGCLYLHDDGCSKA